MLIRDRERITVDPVARLKLPLEIGGPEIVRRMRHRIDDARMHMRRRRRRFFTKPRRSSRSLTVLAAGHAMPRFKPSDQFHRAPARMRSSCRAQQISDIIGDLVRARMRGAAAISEPAFPIRLKPRYPFVARLPRHAVSLTELRSIVPIGEPLAHKLQSLLHGNSVQPRHRRTSAVDAD